MKNIINIKNSLDRMSALTYAANVYKELPLSDLLNINLPNAFAFMDTEEGLDFWLNIEYRGDDEIDLEYETYAEYVNVGKYDSGKRKFLKLT
jgi:hypothetical protein